MKLFETSYLCLDQYRISGFSKPVISMVKLKLACKNVINRERGTATLPYSTRNYRILKLERLTKLSIMHLKLKGGEAALYIKTLVAMV